MAKKKREITSTNFCVRIDYKKDSPNPERVFQAMSELLTAFQDFDKQLVRALDVEVETVQILQDVETGSLKAFISSALKKVPDSAIENLEWKQIVGHYLVKCKHKLIDWLDGKQQITDSSQIIDIQHEILDTAKETGLHQLDGYNPVAPKVLVNTIADVNKALSTLKEGQDSAELITSEGQTSFNLGLKVSASALDDLITKEKISSDSTMVLKVKKPDYLGDSMWEFYDDHVIKVKVIHYEWLQEFQSRKVDVRPGDHIRARVRTTVKYGFDYSIVDKHYDLLQVLEVIPEQPTARSLGLFDS